MCQIKQIWRISLWRIKQTALHTKDRNFAGANKNVTN